MIKDHPGEERLRLYWQAETEAFSALSGMPICLFREYRTMEDEERIRRRILAEKIDDIIDQLRDLMDEIGYSNRLGMCLRDDLADLSAWLQKWVEDK